MQLEKVLEEIDVKIAGSMGKKREGFLEARDIIRNLSRENTPEITRCSRDNDGWIPVEERLPTQEECKDNERESKMLYPMIELEKKHTYCTCGAPNFRSVSEWNKPIKKIFKLTLPKSPCGTTIHCLCEDCLKKIMEGEQNE